MDNVKSQLKKIIKEKAAEGTKVRQEIESLKWKPEAMAEVRSARTKRDESGRKTSGKKALKAFRRPETGQERYHLWNDKRSVGYDARIALLAYGVYRGMPYARIEKCADTNKPSAWTLHNFLAAYLSKEAAAAFTKETIQGWLDGGEAPRFASEEAA